jgi:hypothetical protein
MSVRAVYVRYRRAGDYVFGRVNRFGEVQILMRWGVPSEGTPFFVESEIVDQKGVCCEDRVDGAERRCSDCREEFAGVSHVDLP